MTSKSPYLSVVISAYGSASFIRSTLEAVIAHLAERGWRGRSPARGRSQRSGRGPRRRVRRRAPGRSTALDRSPAGKGASIQLGMAEAQGEYRCFIDADNGVSFEQIDGAFQLIDRYDIVIGSRYMEGGRAREARALEDDHEPRREPALPADPGPRLHRHAGTDEALPRKRRGRSLPRLRLGGFGFDTELLFLAKRRGLTVREYPVTWDPGDESTANFRRDAIVSILELFQVRWYWLTGRYRR